MLIITTHINTDFDALASCVAAKKLYPEGIVVLPGSSERKVREFMELFNPLKEIKKYREIKSERVDTLVVVDTGSSDRIGELKELLGRVKVHLYDHHKKGDINGIVEVIENAGATTTIMVELLQKKNVSITPLEATLFALGIHEETGSLTFPSTTERDATVLSYLIKKGANLNIISDFLKKPMSREELQLLNELLENSREYAIKGVVVKISRARREEFMEEIAHIAHRIMDMEAIDAIIIMVEIPERVLVIARSRASELDVSELLKNLGGGGHPQASSAIVKGRGVDEIETELIGLLEKIIRTEKTAKDIMTYPPITIDHSMTIKDAEKTLTRYGVNVLPVIRHGKLAGLISRETVEKALFHGFRTHKVITFATTDPVTVTPETPISEIEKIMIEQNQRFMPVMKDERLIGVITRTDLLRTMYEDSLRKMRLEKVSLMESRTQHRNLGDLIKMRFPENIYTILIKTGEIAESLGYNAYLVGGSVRDLLRGEENLDIDIVIEGDGITLARRLAEDLNAKLKTHERFSTAKIFTEDTVIDIATARTEYYEYPASLPRVEFSSIKKDLYRRDFTINTLAVKLNPQDFGILIDFFGGQNDLRDRIIRVLHNMSFVEDPTRVLRAIRFSERFEFRINRHTESLMKTAVKMNLFDRLSSQRLYEEISLLFYEVPPLRAVKRLSEYGLLRIFSSSLSFDQKLKKNLENLENTIAWFNISFINEKIMRDELVLITILWNLPYNSIQKALERFSPHRRFLNKAKKDIVSAREIIERLNRLRSTGHDNVKIYTILNEHSIEAILLSMTVTEDKEIKKWITIYLTELRRIKPEITGKMLLRLGIPSGPVYSRILKGILHERLKGSIKSLEEEIEYARRFRPDPRA